eukprot:TRINITY_DN603_c0_g1_i4.p1 TRINITY_DN603_c0_g1~~TRINITY_DN603_c0_g1_i4.p1  ORF type:complete len:202 (+),score=38.28 TRINITY_DN603_c0_g1_i4:63-668(+)
MSRNKPYKVVIVGDGGVGKSALTIQFVENRFSGEAYDPTLEEVYTKPINFQGKPCMLEIIDTAGQEEFTAIQDHYLRIGMGFLIVYSIASVPSYRKLEEYRASIIEVKEDESFPMVLMGNKIDLGEDKRQIQTEEGQSLAESWNIPFFESSAKERINVDEGYQALIELVVSYRENLEYTSSSDDISLDVLRSENSSCCILL